LAVDGRVGETAANSHDNFLLPSTAREEEEDRREKESEIERGRRKETENIFCWA
jgi:hypothetical protein